MNICFQLFWISLLVSQSAMDMMSLVLLLFSIRYVIKWSSTRTHFFETGLEKLWPLWLSIFFLGLAVNVPLTLWKPSQMFEMKWILVFYGILIFYTAQKPWSKDHFLKIFSGFLLFSCIYALITRSLNFDLISQEPLRDQGRTGGFFNDPMTFAHVYGMFFVFLFTALLNDFYNQKASLRNLFHFVKANWLLSLSAGVCGLSVLLSFTRGIWIAVGIAILAVAFLIHKKWGFLFSGLLVGLFLAFFFLWPNFHDRILFVFNMNENYDGERLWLWKANWKMFTDHPVLGGGYGEYHNWLPNYFDIVGAPENQRLVSHSHNQYLHFLSNTGVLGALCYLIFLFVIFLKSVRLFRQCRDQKISNWILGSCAAQICFFLGGLTECNFERAKVRLTYLALAAIPLAILTLKQLNSDKTKVNQ